MTGSNATGSDAGNESDPARDALDPVLLDRLVDGELAEVERRKVLLALDRQPSGWRECALAFLEAQSWRDLLGITVDQAVSVATDTAPGVSANPSEAAALPMPADRARKSPRKWLWVVEMAASFLVAFSLGLWIRGGFSTISARPANSFAIATPDLSLGAGTQTVDVVTEGDGGKIEKMPVPLVDGSRLGWLPSQPAVGMPEEVRRTVEQSGWQVRLTRKYFSVELPDGRRGVVPIDQLQVVPVGNR